MVAFIVHQSTIKCWRRCKRQYYYQYVLNLEKRKRPKPLLRGTVVHKMLENEAEGKDVWKPVAEMQKEFGKLFEEEREYYGDLPGEINTIMSGYFRWYGKFDPLHPIAPRGSKHLAEHSFEVNLTPSIELHGRIDRVSSDKSKHVWMQDHKTVKTLPQGDLKYSDIQSVIYTWVMPQIGFPPAYGVIWDYIKWKTPTAPDLLKNGSMSRRANIDTTWTTYEKALVDNNLDPSEYQDMKELLEGKEDDFFVRQYLPINMTLSETLLEEARTTAREMKRKGGVDKTRTIERHCDWCSFYGLCQAELRGQDSDFILKHDYQEKKNEKQDIPSTEEDD